MNKVILVPIDFSPLSKRALEFALALAQKENASISLLHVIFMNEIRPKGDIQVGTIEPEMTEDQSNLKLESAYGEWIRKLGVKFTCQSMLGFPADIIIKAANEIKPWMLVMGTQGASGVQEIVLGSNTAKVIEQTACPVIAVPAGATYKGINKITYATDYNASDLNALKELISIASPMKATITLLHISDGELTPDAESQIMEKFKAACKEAVSYDRLEFLLVKGKGIEAALQEHAKNQSPDLLAMSTRKRTLLDKIFGPSVTKKMAFHSEVPLLAFHHKKDSIIFIS